MAVTLKVAADERHKNTNEEYPIRLTVTFNRKPVPYTTIFSLTEEEIKKLNAPRISEKLQNVKNKMREIEAKARETAQKLEPFSHENFRLNFILGNPLFVQKKLKAPTAPPVQNSFTEFDYTPYTKKFQILRLENINEKGRIGYTYLKIVKQLIREERIGTALKYNDSFAAIYKNAGNVTFKEINVNFLKAFEAHIVNNGSTRNWVGSIARHLRAAFNDAIDDGILIKSPETYPFGKRRYKIPAGARAKTPIEDDGMTLFYNSIPTCPSEERAKDFWFFQYFGNGMNPKDMCYLKWKDRKGQYFTFIREKSKLTSEITVKITAFITEDMERILNKWGNADKSPENYVFPILTDGLNALQQTQKVKRFADFIREWTQKLSKRLELPKISSKDSRIQFASDLKYADINKEYIRDALGHTSSNTTDNYLGAFRQEVVKNHAQVLGKFKQQISKTETEE